MTRRVYSGFAQTSGCRDDDVRVLANVAPVGRRPAAGGRLGPNARQEARTLPTMKQPEEADLMAALQALSERERQARDRLIQARDELNDRDDRFAALEAELWARFEEHERRAREEIARHAQEEARLREEAIRLRDEAIRLHVRLDRIQASMPMRLYASIRHLPVVRRVAARRAREYEATLHARLQG